MMDPGGRFHAKNCLCTHRTCITRFTTQKSHTYGHDAFKTFRAKATISYQCFTDNYPEHEQRGEVVVSGILLRSEAGYLLSACRIHRHSCSEEETVRPKHLTPLRYFAPCKSFPQKPATAVASKGLSVFPKTVPCNAL